MDTLQKHEQQENTKIIRRAPRELLPYLSVEEDKEHKTNTGFLHLRNPEKKLRIGEVASREFKLILCLFSPENFLSAKHRSVSQTRERVLAALGASRYEGVLAQKEEPTNFALVQKSIQGIKRKEIGKFLTFTFQENKIQMLVG